MRGQGLSPVPFFTRQGDLFQPTDMSRGPWSPTDLHGRVVVGLLGAEAERAVGDDAFMPARLTVDMYRMPDLSPLSVTTRLLRDGGRIKLVEAELLRGDVSMARAVVLFLRKTANAGGAVWSPPPWAVPAPADIPEPADIRAAMNGMWAVRPISGGFGMPGKRQIWMSEVRPLVDDDPWTPFSRVAVAADFASPFANSGEGMLGYINTDVSVYLHRLPATAWIGFEVVNHHAADGVAIGECWLHDEQGAIGTATVAALAQKMPAGIVGRK